MSRFLFSLERELHAHYREKPQKASQHRLSANTKLSVLIFLFSLSVIFLSVINIGLVNKFLGEKKNDIVVSVRAGVFLSHYSVFLPQRGNNW